MRPIKLDIRNLRSYRESDRIDFTGKGLVAIIGDTGAGKSSILEALCFALYGQSTFGRETKELIPEDLKPSEESNTTGSPAAHMTVGLEFEASEARWWVLRSVPAGSSPPAEHRLELLEDYSGAYQEYETLSGKRAVDGYLERLIGLDFSTFRSSVLLPQGRFSDLLYETPAKRAATLKSLFGLEELDTMREREKERSSEAATGKDNALLERAALGYDTPPSGNAEEAENSESNGTSSGEFPSGGPQEAARRDRAKEKEARGRKGDLEEAAEKVSAEEVAAQRERELIERCEGEREALRGHVESLAVYEGRMTPLQETLDASEAEYRSSQEELRASSTRYRSARESRDKHRLEYGPRASLGDARDAALTLENAVSEGLRSRSEAEDNQSDETRKERQAVRLEEEASEAARQEEESAGKASSLEKSTAEMRGRLGDADLDGLCEDFLRSARESLRADYEAEQAREEYEEYLRAHAVHMLASGISRGDTCPVCEGIVAETPGIAGESVEDGDEDYLESDAGEKSRVASREAAKLLSEYREAAGRLRDALRLLDGDTVREVSGSHAYVQPHSIANLQPNRAEGNDEYDYESLASLARSPESLREASEIALGEVNAALQQAKEEAEGARKHAREAHGAFREAAAEREAAGNARKRSEEDAQKHLDSIKEASEGLSSILGTLPNSESFLETPLLSGFDWQDLEELLSCGKLESFRSELGSILSRREYLEEESERLSGEEGAARERLESAEAAFQEARRGIEAPREAAEALERVIASSEKLEAPGREEGAGGLIPENPEGMTGALASLKRGRLADERVEIIRRESEKREEASIARCERILRAAGVNSGAELHSAIEEVGARALSSRHAAEAAEAAIEPHERLTALATEKEYEERVHAELASHITDGRFVGYCVERRQRELLAVSSDLLARMTEDRYGFAEDFRVVELSTNTAREGRTLSGGETFLASLSLALGLVEMTARRGGKLDAFFLDEGFGTLDEETLEDALGALEEKASSSGSLICLISHVPAVAERLDNVLEVRETPEGSKTTWRSDSSSEQWMQEVAPYGDLGSESSGENARQEEAGVPPEAEEVERASEGESFEELQGRLL